MNISKPFVLAGMIVALTASLAACAPKVHPTRQQVQDMKGLSTDVVNAKLGMPSSVTNAGDSLWWEYVGVITPEGGTVDCHIVFKNGIADTIKC